MVMVSQFSGAVMNEARDHRFLLWRYWDDDRPRMMFIGLNPSTANEIQNDPTIRRLIGFAQRWGYGGLYACNLFSQVTPYPEHLNTDAREHAANVPAIKMAAGLSELVLCAWGDGIDAVPDGKRRADFTKNLMNNPKCFGLTGKGNPKHPLYLPKESQLEDY